jgi:hypothetical protein
MPHQRHDPQTSSPATSRQTEQASARNEHTKALNAFVGEWRAEGQQLAGPVGAAAKITATQKYEWLQGEMFLIHRFDGHVGESSASCIEIMGYDRDTGLCRIHTFYNNGLKNVWDVERHADRWQLYGDWNMAGKSMKVRCTITFGDDGRSMRNLWEYSEGGAGWQAFWDLHARKTLPH